jgi:hypothetical protein
LVVLQYQICCGSAGTHSRWRLSAVHSTPSSTESLALQEWLLISRN